MFSEKAEVTKINKEKLKINLRINTIKLINFLKNFIH